ncbi:MAG: helix-turn-helix domain-containing protein [Polyangiaceae bacterium]
MRELRALYTVGETAELLGLSRHAVARLVARGALPTVTLGGKRWVPLSALYASVMGARAERGR